MTQRILLVACLSIVATVANMGHAQLRSPLITELEAQQRGLTRAWYVQVPVDRSRDRLQSVNFYDGTLFTQTERGTITALDGETGERLWTTNIGKPDHPTTAIGANKLYVAALNGSTLYVLFRENGKLFWERQMKGAPGAGPALTGDHVFVPMINGLVEGYELDDHRRPPWIYNSSGRAIVQPVVTAASIGWPTDRGLFYVAGSELLTVRFRVEAVEPIVTKAGYSYPHFFVPSLDGYLYKVHERSGSMVWRFSAGNPISKQPLAVEDKIFLTAERSGLFCVANVAADELWWTPRIEQVLSVSEQRVYGVDTSGRLNVMRADTGAVLSKFDVSGLDILLTNTENDRLYLANKYGVVQCLREVELVEPFVHGGPGEAEEERAETVQRGLDDVLAEPPKEERPAAPAGNNPFGNDPFGGGGDAADPFGGGGDTAPPAADDPFGGGGAADPFGGGGAADPFGGGGGGAADPFGGGGAAPPPAGGADPFGGGNDEDDGGGDDDPPAGDADPFGGGADPFG
ncbi:MAG: PQQ-binding-like beta-propeller repeat protein [Pirellulales bacterium]